MTKTLRPLEMIALRKAAKTLAKARCAEIEALLYQRVLRAAAEREVENCYGDTAELLADEFLDEATAHSLAIDRLNHTPQRDIDVVGEEAMVESYRREIAAAMGFELN